MLIISYYTREKGQRNINGVSGDKREGNYSTGVHTGAGCLHKPSDGGPEHYNQYWDSQRGKINHHGAAFGG
jgi:hypothetical protein